MEQQGCPTFHFPLENPGYSESYKQCPSQREPPCTINVGKCIFSSFAMFYERCGGKYDDDGNIEDTNYSFHECLLLWYHGTKVRIKLGLSKFCCLFDVKEVV